MNDIKAEVMAIERDYLAVATQVGELLVRVEAIQPDTIDPEQQASVRQLELNLLELRDFLNHNNQ